MLVVPGIRAKAGYFDKLAVTNGYDMAWLVM
jgi:hypothetical protein